jgi:hypothetical protein
VSRNGWYLYYDRRPGWAEHGGTVRAVIEVVTGRMNSDEPGYPLRGMFIEQGEAATEAGDLSEAWASDGWIPLSDLIIGGLTDEEFEQLIADGTIIPLRVP